MMYDVDLVKTLEPRSQGPLILDNSCGPSKTHAPRSNTGPFATEKPPAQTGLLRAIYKDAQDPQRNTDPLGARVRFHSTDEQ